MSPKSPVDDIVDEIRAFTKMEPKVAIVCGSGMGEAISFIEKPVVVPYSAIKGFFQTTVSGHKGNFVFGHVGSIPVVAMQGRMHQYEGYTHEQMVLPMRVLKLLGVSIVLMTNAAGGLSEKLQVGDFVVLKDHISPAGFCCANVLVGPNDERFGPRFPATSDAYDPTLRTLMFKAAKKLGQEKRVHEGVYFHVMGPTYTTKAECKMMRILGGDVVGMSTVPEVFVARHCGLRVVAVSLVSDGCNPNLDEIPPLTHEEVLETARNSTGRLNSLLKEFISML